jgi:hypothetical protein
VHIIIVHDKTLWDEITGVKYRQDSSFVLSGAYCYHTVLLPPRMFKLLVFICAGVKVTATLFIATIQIVTSSR